jgi:hypothetical protein
LDFNGWPPLLPAWQYGRVNFVLRAASPADAGDLVALWREAAENSRRPPDTAEAVTALLGRDPEALILAEHDGALIGVGHRGRGRLAVPPVPARGTAWLPPAGRLAPLV